MRWMQEAWADWATERRMMAVAGLVRKLSILKDLGMEGRVL